MVLPESAAGYGVSVRRWQPRDVGELHRAIAESIEHLRPWMEWAQDEPLTIEQRMELLERWEEEWRRGEEANFAVLCDQGEVVGGCGLRQRGGRQTLEIGYWTRAGHLRRGIATSAARLLTDLAFGLASTEYVEIHHDKANHASRGVPLRLGYDFVGERPDDRGLPAEMGIDCAWRTSRDTWSDTQTSRPGAEHGVARIGRLSRGTRE